MVEYMYCRYFIPSKPFGGHLFNDTPRLTGVEALGLSVVLCTGSFVFIGDVDVGASPTEALLGYWLSRVGQGRWKYLAYLCPIKIKIITLQCLLCALGCSKHFTWAVSFIPQTVLSFS